MLDDSLNKAPYSHIFERYQILTIREIRQSENRMVGIISIIQPYFLLFLIGSILTFFLLILIGLILTFFEIFLIVSLLILGHISCFL